ncbi:MAG: hypothetical protein AAF639_25500 [Chloroflexota bacterium]
MKHRQLIIQPHIGFIQTELPQTELSKTEGSESESVESELERKQRIEAATDRVFARRQSVYQRLAEGVDESSL